MGLFEWCQAIEASAVGQAIKTSSWAFAVIESVHLLGLAVTGGTILLVDLRTLGIGLRQQPVATLARDAHPIFVAGLFVMVVTGTCLFMSEAVKCYYSNAFWLKMTCLALALAFTFTVRRRVTLADDHLVGPIWRALVAVVSLVLWFGVAASGRWIGFSG